MKLIDKAHGIPETLNKFKGLQQYVTCSPRLQL